MLYDVKHKCKCKRNPKNKQQLLVDKESANVVKRIYRLVIEGYGVTQIADILTKDKIFIPSAYAEIHYPKNNHSSKKRGIEDPYFWTPTTIGYILEKREYIESYHQRKVDTDKFL